MQPLEIHNPHAAQAQVAFSDGTAFLLRFDLNALVLLDQAKKKSVGEFTRFEFLRAALWAGTYRDAVRQGREWTVEIVGELMSSGIKRHGELVDALMSEAVFGPGESPAGENVETHQSVKAPSRTGKKR